MFPDEVRRIAADVMAVQHVHHSQLLDPVAEVA